MNHETSQNSNPWPEGQTPAEEQQLAEAWQLLGGALSNLENSSGFAPLSDSRLMMMAARVDRHVRVARRRRVRSLTLAAGLLLALGVGLMALAPQPAGVQQVAHVAAPEAPTATTQTSMAAPAIAKVPAANAAADELANDRPASAWNEDDWLAAVSSAQLEVEAVESDWSGNYDTWSEVQEQMDELESELDDEVSL